MLAPHLCSDDELMSLYDDAIRSHPIASTLAERLAQAKEGEALAVTEEALVEAEKELAAANGRVELLTEALADLLADRSEKTKAAARNLLESK